MKDYLIFQLYGPLASWGEIAVGEVRPSAAYPSRSALLGLLAAALGVERGEGAALAALAEAYRFGVKLHWEGQVLRDYHTVQRGPALRKHTYRTRRQELGFVPRDQLDTMLTSREYRVDSYASVALLPTEEAPHSLDVLAAALGAPRFPLYLGRKSCPLALPLAARVAPFADLRSALDALGPEQIDGLLGSRTDPLRRVARRAAPRYYWDARLGPEGLAPGITPSLTLTRHDEPTSRQRWQFAPRQEYLLIEEARP